MSEPAPEPTAEEDHRVEDWREEYLLRAGFPPEAAIQLSRDPAVDIHLAERLLERGCAPSVAVDILGG